jgi:cytidylate kinase
MYYQIAIDGPAGSGKSTTAKHLAQKLGFTHINSGGLFRCYALLFIRNHATTEEQFIPLLEKNNAYQVGDALFLNDEDVTKECYSQHVARFVPNISMLLSVREKVMATQHIIADKQNIVVEGRDTTSVVFPRATLKIFLTATDHVRAIRR